MTTMTKEQLAAKLEGLKYPVNINRDIIAEAREAGLVIVYGASYDLIEFDGAFLDEYGVYGGGTVQFDAQGLLGSWDDVKDDEKSAAAYITRKDRAREVEAIWDSGEGYSWTYKTDLPHATFDITENDGEDGLYCRGIVIDLADIGKVSAPPQLLDCDRCCEKAAAADRVCNDCAEASAAHSADALKREGE